MKLMGLSVDGPQLCLLYEYVHGRTLRKALAKVCSTDSFLSIIFFMMLL